MSLQEVSISGTLLPNGTLQLDEVPALSPGPVTVVVRQATSSALPNGGQSWFEIMQQTRQQMEQADCRLLNDDELAARIDSLRERDAVDDLLQSIDPKNGKEAS
jgi:hypothetical protein